MKWNSARNTFLGKALCPLIREWTIWGKLLCVPRNWYRAVQIHLPLQKRNCGVTHLGTGWDEAAARIADQEIPDELGDRGGCLYTRTAPVCIPPRMPLFFFYYLPVLEVVQSCQTFTSTAARLFQSSSMETTEGSKSLSPRYSYFWGHIQIRETVNMHVHIGHQIQISCLISNLSNKFSSQSTSQYQYGTAHWFCFAATTFMHF